MLNRFRCLQARRVGLAPSKSKSSVAKLPAFDDMSASASASKAAAKPSQLDQKLKSSLPPSKTGSINSKSGENSRQSPESVAKSGPKGSTSSAIKSSIKTAAKFVKSNLKDAANSDDSGSFKKADNSDKPNFKEAADSDKPNFKEAAASDKPNFKEAADSDRPNFKEAADYDKPNFKEAANSDKPNGKVATNSNTSSFKESESIKVADKDASIEAASESDSSQNSFASAQQNLEDDQSTGAAMSSQQFNSLFDTALKAVSNCSTEQLCNDYLKVQPNGKASPAKPDKKREQPEAKRTSRGRKRKASPSKSETKPAVDFEFATGTWIECSQCKKWRHEPGIAEPCRVPDNWRCSESTDARQNDCGLVELTDYFYAQGTNFALSNKYVAGSLVWARVQGYPYWPAIVEVDSDYGTFFELEAESNDVAAYHVTFLSGAGRSASRAWVADSRIRPFLGANDLTDSLAGLGKGALPKPGSSAELELRRLAEEAANVAAKLDFDTRLRRYGFFAGERAKKVTAATSQPKSKSTGGKGGNKKQKIKDMVDRGGLKGNSSKQKAKLAKRSKPKSQSSLNADDTGNENGADETLAVSEVADDVNDSAAVDLLEARDKFRRRVSQLCQLRGEAGQVDDDNGEDAGEAEYEDL